MTLCHRSRCQKEAVASVLYPGLKMSAPNCAEHATAEESRGKEVLWWDELAPRVSEEETA